MRANYHTHTPRCNHATGSEEAYIAQAIAQKMDILGFSDHTPYFFPGDYYSFFRMRPELLQDYTSCLSALKEKYRSTLQIHIGLEAEFYPAYIPELMSFLEDYPIEYMILGQHFVGNEPNGQYSGTPTADCHILEQYCRQVRDAMQTGCYTYWAHPDIINFIGDSKDYQTHMRAAVQEAKSCGLPLEINLLGMQEGRQYPSRRFLEIAAEENAPMILGWDAHSPEGLSIPKTEAAARNLAAEYGITLIEYTDLKPIHR